MRKSKGGEPYGVFEPDLLCKLSFSFEALIFKFVLFFLPGMETPNSKLPRTFPIFCFVSVKPHMFTLLFIGIRENILYNTFMIGLSDMEMTSTTHRLSLELSNITLRRGSSHLLIRDTLFIGIVGEK